MSVARPTNEPRWADVSGAITEPSSGKKDTGWVAVSGIGEKPRLQYFNWFMNRCYQFIHWLAAQAAIIDEANVFSDTNAFQKKVTITNSVSNTMALQATGNGTAEGINASSASGPAMRALANATRGSLNMPGVSTDPSSIIEGDLFVDSQHHALKIGLGGSPTHRAIPNGKAQVDGSSVIAIHEDGTVINAAGGSAPAFGTGWANKGGGERNFTPYIDSAGRVCFTGRVKGTAPGATIATLPARMLPADGKNVYLAAYNDDSSAAYLISINGTTGVMTGPTAGNPDVCLDGLSYTLA